MPSCAEGASGPLRELKRQRFHIRRRILLPFILNMERKQPVQTMMSPCLLVLMETTIPYDKITYFAYVVIMIFILLVFMIGIMSMVLVAAKSAYLICGLAYLAIKDPWPVHSEIRLVRFLYLTCCPLVLAFLGFAAIHGWRDRQRIFRIYQPSAWGHQFAVPGAVLILLTTGYLLTVIKRFFLGYYATLELIVGCLLAAYSVKSFSGNVEVFKLLGSLSSIYFIVRAFENLKKSADQKNDGTALKLARERRMIFYKTRAAVMRLIPKRLRQRIAIGV
jgi:hypothetical protein